jgi:hypothetical protein
MEKCCHEVNYEDKIWTLTLDLIQAGEAKEVKKMVETNKGKVFLSTRNKGGKVTSQYQNQLACQRLCQNYLFIY